MSRTIEEILKSFDCCHNTDQGCPNDCPYRESEQCIEDRDKDVEQILKTIQKHKHAISEMYYEGLKDAWRLAEKIVFIDKDGGLTCKQFNEIFGGKNKGEVFEMDPKEVFQRIEDWTNKNEFNIGNLVKPNTINSDGIIGVITRIEENTIDSTICNITVLWDDGSAGTYEVNELINTGETVNMEEFFSKVKKLES